MENVDIESAHASDSDSKAVSSVENPVHDAASAAMAKAVARGLPSGTLQAVAGLPITGVLKKLGGRKKDTWQEREITLNLDGLTWQDGKGLEAKDMVSVAVWSDIGYNHAFEVVSRVKDEKVYRFSCADDAAQQSWIAAIDAVIDITGQHDAVAAGQPADEFEAPNLETSEGEPERQQWGSRLEFLLATLGYAVGLGNVCWFPYKCASNGGGTFLIPYAIALFTLGMPLVMLEMAIGQHFRKGTLHSLIQLDPRLRSLGLVTCYASYGVAIYYIVVISWAMYYFVMSFTSPLPWVSKIKGCNPGGTSADYWWHCVLEVPAQYKWEDGGGQQGSGWLPHEEQYGLNHVSLHLLVCFTICWVLVFFALARGVESSGKVVLFTATSPYVFLLFMFLRGITLPGAGQGIAYYLTPDLAKLFDPNVWVAAITQIFFSLGPGYGSHIALSSYNPKDENIVWDAKFICCANCLTSFFAGFAVFSLIGHLAYLQGVPVEDVLDTGIGLAFVVFPQGLSEVWGAHFFSASFFAMLFFLGIDGEFATMEVVTTLFDDAKVLPLGKAATVGVLCCVGWVLGLVMVFDTGFYWFNLLSSWPAYLCIFGTCLLECIGAAYLWEGGTRRLSDLIEQATGHAFPKWYHFLYEKVIPAVMVLLLLISFVSGINQGGDVLAQKMKFCKVGATQPRCALRASQGCVWAALPSTADANINCTMTPSSLATCALSGALGFNLTGSPNATECAGTQLACAHAAEPTMGCTLASEKVLAAVEGASAAKHPFVRFTAWTLALGPMVLMAFDWCVEGTNAVEKVVVTLVSAAVCALM